MINYWIVMDGAFHRCVKNGTLEILSYSQKYQTTSRLDISNTLSSTSTFKSIRVLDTSVELYFVMDIITLKEIEEYKKIGCSHSHSKDTEHKRCIEILKYRNMGNENLRKYLHTVFKK